MSIYKYGITPSSRKAEAMEVEMAVHGSTSDRAEKIKDAAIKCAADYHREGDLVTANTLLDLSKLEDESLARLYNILNNVK